jgi:hypothetical protein
LLQEHNIAEAVAAFNEVEQMDAAIVSADLWNKLCWDGAVMNSAQQVLNAVRKPSLRLKTMFYGWFATAAA